MTFAHGALAWWAADIMHALMLSSRKILNAIFSVDRLGERRYLCEMLKTDAGRAEKLVDGPAAGDASTQGGVSLHGEVLLRLRDYIVEGNLAEGERVPERELCEKFGISRTPLREALKVLASEGLLELLPNRGARIRALTKRDLTELFDVMGGLEALAGRLACENVTDEEIAEIEKLHYEMYGCYLRRDLHGYFQFNQSIHEKIVAAGRNSILAETYASFAGRLRRVRFSANMARDRDRWSEAMREHEVILDALRRRHGQELTDILFVHLRNKREALLEGADSIPPPRKGDSR